MLIIALLSAFCYYLLSHFIATISILNWNGEAFFGACLSVHHFFFCPRHGLISQWLRLGILVLAMAIEIVVTDLAGEFHVKRCALHVIVTCLWSWAGVDQFDNSLVLH